MQNNCLKYIIPPYPRSSSRPDASRQLVPVFSGAAIGKRTGRLGPQPARKDSSLKF